MKCMLLLLCFCFGFICCNKCQDDPNLNAEELSWMPYHGGETLIYKSTMGVYDTLKVGQKIVHTWNIEDWEQEDHISCKYTTQELEIQIGQHSFNISHKNMDVTYSKPHWPGNTPGGDIPLLDGMYLNNSRLFNNIVLNGKTFNNVHNLGGLYYTKEEGLIAFPGPNANDSLYVKVN